MPRVHLQGNGRYALMVTNAGGGYSRWKEFDITAGAPTRRSIPGAAFIYIRDMRSDAIWATAQQPAGGQGIASAHFSADRAEFHRRVSNIETVLDVTVAAEDDVNCAV